MTTDAQKLRLQRMARSLWLGSRKTKSLMQCIEEAKQIYSSKELAGLDREDEIEVQ